MKRSMILIALAAGLSVACGGKGWRPEGAEGQPAAQKRPHEVEEAVGEMLEKDPGLQRFFDQAWGFVIFPTVGKGGAGLGGAHGKGWVYEQGVLVGRAKLTQVTAGFQLGGQAYRELLFFEDDKAMKDFKGGHFELGAQASAVAVESGASADASYDRGVAVFTMARGGLMVEATVGGQKFGFETLEEAQQ